MPCACVLNHILVVVRVHVFFFGGGDAGTGAHKGGKLRAQLQGGGADWQSSDEDEDDGEFAALLQRQNARKRRLAQDDMY